VLQALADATPAGLRLTQASFDPVRGETLLTGYGSEDKADFEVTTLLHALNANARVQETFSAARLMFCNGAKQGKRQVKKFSISMPYRKDAAATAAATAPKDAGV